MTPAELLAIANTVCTPKEIEVLELATRGLSERTIALALGISRSSVRARLENANRKIAIARGKDAA